jgi:NAD(P)-dependent dehydrogenase (short-subunit alcohol dehydrogenase family)
MSLWADKTLKLPGVAIEAQKIGGKESAIAIGIDIRDRESIRQALRETVAAYGGVDIIVNTAAIFPSSPDGRINDAQWGLTLDVNVTANHRLLEEASKILREQDLTASVVLVSSANAVVPKSGSEAYDVSKAAVSHLVREFAISLAPKVRVNGISPATVVNASTMFPLDRVSASLKKYLVLFDEAASDEQLRSLLAEFYAKRTLIASRLNPRIARQPFCFSLARSRTAQPVINPRDGANGSLSAISLASCSKREPPKKRFDS